MRVIFHIDVNNAFLSWTALENLKNGSKVDLRTIASVVGGDESKRHGVVLAKSMIAKKAGVVTGEPLFEARRKCKNLVVVPSNHEKYEEYSDQFYELLCKYSPKIERYSIDECFLDMTGTQKMFGDSVLLAHKIKDEIKEKLGFTVNVGVGNSKLCAKMASDFEKPDKVHTLFENEVKEKMWPLRVDDLFMVGKKTSLKLHELGIHTIGDLAKSDSNVLSRHFKSFGQVMLSYANGIDDAPVEDYVAKNKGIGNSVTMPSDLTSLNEIKAVIKKLSIMVGRRLRKEKMYALCVTLQLKNSEFITYLHQKKLVNPICSDDDIYDAACELLENMWKKDSIRLVGVRVSAFTDKPYEQISLFEEPGKIEKRGKVQKAVDEINEKFGNNTIVSANLINNVKKSK